MALLDLNLPPGDTARWSPHRIASVVNDVRGGAISFDEACQRYLLSAEERQILQNSTITPRGNQPRMQHTGIKRSVGCHKTVNKMGRGV
jgi:hypothetical protein